MPRTCLILLCVCCLGLHGGVLQVVAWSGMLISYGSERGMVSAVAMTFSGEHPCRMCHAISAHDDEPAEATRQERPLPVIDHVPLVAVMVPPPLVCGRLSEWYSGIAPAFTPDVELPPPRRC